MARPTFSIITVSFDQGSLLRGAIESAVRQECAQLEHIIIERGTTSEAAAIASEYSHVIFIQEPFTTEAQALNYALSKTTGEVVSVLAPGERYCAAAFARVAQEIVRHPIIMGAVSLTSAAGDVVEKIENIERSWFDSLKYWVARAMPSRAGVFFKRDVLLELGIEGDDTFDEGLRFVPDFDLWLRIQERYPFSLTLPTVVATSPVSYSKISASYQRELSRIYRRHCSRRIHPEQSLSFVIACDEPSDQIDLFIESIQNQSLPGIEVVLVDSIGTSVSYDRLCVQASQYESRFRNLTFQVVPIHNDPQSKVTPVDRGVRSARSGLVACVQPCGDMPKHFAIEALRLFLRDEVGLILPRLEKGVAAQLFTIKHGTAVFNPTGPFSLTSAVPIDYVVRKVAWLDCGRSLSYEKLFEREFVSKRLMVMMAHKAWRIQHEPLLPPQRERAGLAEEPFRLYVNSLVVDEIAREMKRSPFSIVRANLGFGLVLSDDLWQAAQEVIRNIPERSLGEAEEISIEQLCAIVGERPAYGPAHYVLAKALEGKGDSHHAKAVRSQWEDIHKEERSSPLYGGVEVSGLKRP
jgi:glycosyltransferase involved in cell wall biosynthesis